MPNVFLPRDDLKKLIKHRRRCDGDRLDEVWNGVYVVSPLANNEHQGIITQLTLAFLGAYSGDHGVQIFPGANVSDQTDRWARNFRCPDVAVFLPGNPAQDRDSHWFGGPDFAVEIISKDDRSREKFEFYAKVGVRELLLVDRFPWRLELYRNSRGEWIDAGSFSQGDSGRIVSEVLPVSFRLIRLNAGPKIEVRHSTDGRVLTS